MPHPHSPCETDLATLIVGCHEEDHAAVMYGFCWELFRRAVTGQSTEAWAGIYAQYRERMIRWARWYGAADASEADDVVHTAWLKFGAAMRPEVLARCPGIQSVLAYLRRCVQSVYLDERRREKREQAYLESWPASEPTPGRHFETMVLEETVRHESATYIYARLKGEEERLVLVLSFEYDMKPAEIAAQHPTVFASAREVSRVKERVLRRLANDPQLRQWREAGK